MENVRISGENISGKQCISDLQCSTTCLNRFPSCLQSYAVEKPCGPTHIEADNRTTVCSGIHKDPVISLGDSCIGERVRSTKTNAVSSLSGAGGKGDVLDVKNPFILNDEPTLNQGKETLPEEELLLDLDEEGGSSLTLKCLLSISNTATTVQAADIVLNSELELEDRRSKRRQKRSCRNKCTCSVKRRTRAALVYIPLQRV